MPFDPEPGQLPETGTPSPLPLLSERVFKALEEAGSLLLLFILLTALFTVVLLFFPGLLPPPDPDTPLLLGDPEVTRMISEFGMRILRAATIANFFSLPLTFIGYVAVRERKRLRAWFRIDGRSTLLGLGAGAAMFAAGFCYEFVLQAMQIEVPDVAAQRVAALPPALLVLAVAVLAPIGEELYFRGRLFEGLGRWYGEPRAVTVSAALFAFAHMIAPLLPIYFLFGLILLALRRKTGGLAAPVIAHIVNNGAGLLLTWAYGLRSS